MMDTSPNFSGNVNSQRRVETSSNGALQTPEISPEKLEDRLQDIIADPDRLDAVHETSLMDTPAEEAFDRFTRLASHILDVPVTMVSLIDDKRHYFKSDVGLPEPYASTRERPMARSFCQYTIALGYPLVVEDAQEHPLVCDNPATQEFGIRGYMGVPLITEDGHGIGNFCALDTEPRTWSEEQLQALNDLAASVTREIETRSLVRRREADELRKVSDNSGSTEDSSENLSGREISQNGGTHADRTEVQFHRLLDKLPTGAYMCNREGLITYFNERAAEVWGRKPELYDPIDRFCGSLKLYMPDGTPVDHEACWMAKTLENEREYQEEIIIERPDGGRIFALVHAMPLHDASGTLLGAINVVTDISERRETEKELRQSKRELADFFENATVPMHWVGPDGRVLRVNQAELELLGCSRDEVIGRHITDFHADSDVIEDILERLTSGQELRDYEARLRRKDGSIRHVLISSNALWEDGEFVHTRCITRDVTERKRAKQKLRESKDELASKVADMERLHALSMRLLRQDDVGAALREVMEASAELLSADKASVQIYDEEEDVLRLVGSLNFDAAFDEQFRIVKAGSITTCAAALRQRDQVLVENLSTDKDFYEFYRASRRYEVEAAFSTPLYGSGGRLLGMFTMYWDNPHHPAKDELQLLDLYTQQAARQVERRRAEEKLRSTKEEAEKTARLRSNLLANVSHEIRTPITGILGLAEGLEEKVADERREEVQLIEQSGRRLMETLDSVLALAQLEGEEIEVNTERINVSEEVEEVTRSFQRQADQKGLSLEVTSSVPETRARLDRSLLRRILNNLISNAIKFTEEGVVRVEVSATDKNVSIAVADTGIGISEEFQARLFDEFTQESTGFSRTHEGVGLGLPLTKKMTEQMNGTIAVTSEKGKGSVFTVSFPRSFSKDSTGEDHLEGSVLDAEANGMDTEKATSILLIEDNEIIRRVIVERLGERHGYEVEAFEEAEPALERANERAFDVVLIDISLPGIDGMEALHRLRSTETYDDRPIIAVTGHALPGDRERFLEEGFSDYMGKPFSADDLAEKIRSLET